MHGHEKKQEVAINKKLVILFMTLFSIVIILMGSIYCAYSVFYNIQFTVLNSSVHGLVIGLIVAFLGVRYLLAVRKLKVEVYKSTSSFSFSNFKK